MYKNEQVKRKSSFISNINRWTPQNHPGDHLLTSVSKDTAQNI